MARVVFDIDDTLCYSSNGQSFDNLTPRQDVITKLNYLHDKLGIEIVLHTSRGMVSCNGDKDKILDKYDKTIRCWLEENDVHYDELVFMKPLADLYIDDKAMDVDEFLSERFYDLGGGSGSSVTRLGKYVKKEFPSYRDRLVYQEWQDINKDLCVFNVPDVISYSYTSVIMKYVKGIQAAYLSYNDANDILDKVFDMIRKEINKSDGFVFDISKQVEVMLMNVTNDNSVVDSIIYSVASMITKKRSKLEQCASFCHGDLTFGNIVVSDNGDINVIDPRHISRSSSYILDLAKLKMSVSGYEKMFFDANDMTFLAPKIDYFAKLLDVEYEVDLFYLMYIIRLLRYKKFDDRDKVENWIVKAYDGFNAKWN